MKKYMSPESMQMVGGPVSKKPEQHIVSDEAQENKRFPIENFGTKVSVKAKVDVCEGEMRRGGKY